MSAPRLTTLFPSLFRTTPLIARRTSVRQRPRTSACSAACFHPSATRPDQDRPQRYGTAKPPPPHLKSDEVGGGEGSKAKPEGTAPTVPEEMLLSQKNNYTALPAPGHTSADQRQSPPSTAQDVADQNASASKPVDTVLDMPSPAEEEERNPPHLQAPRYVHHFDTWSLVRDLDNGGFSEGSAVTLMKAVRQSLADNMELARRALVSKSNVENETYLFRAACAELKTDIQNNRKAEADRWRSQRAQLQHEVEILGQKLTQDAAALKDELKGMFDDRNMLVRMEQKEMERKIQEINYKITVALNSDTRGDVEGVRWLLTRRAALALAIVIFMVLGAINFTRFIAPPEKKKPTKETPADPTSSESGKLESEVLSGEGLPVPEALSTG